MSEQPNPNPTPEDAHDRMHDALSFAETARAPIFERVSRNLYSNAVNNAKVDTRDVTVEYTDAHARRDLEEYPQSLLRLTRVDLNIPQGRYDATLSSGDKSGKSARAGVVREGYLHRFRPESERRAAALITSIAARQLGDHALEHVDKVAAAKEDYLKKRHSK
ncbi:MAG TPA: hypothetical protein VHD60_01535 [Candidatus Saccharimonadales bacterium]|nr:hypothetical protein [Candidatus Saccharimonadales bacterium]